IYHGIDTNVYAYHNKPDEYVLYLGRITYEKGVHHAIAAAKAAGISIIIAGVSYTQEGYWSEYIEPHINGTTVQYVGQANLEKKLALLKHAKALLFPTLYDEAFGLVMIEAMSCGTPVIGFASGAVPEVVQDGESGFVVKNEKQMAEAIKKIQKISRETTRKRVENFFSIERMTRGYEHVFERAIARAKNNRQ
ncbi:MAG: glycosyltransferase, partial [bacterium]|nr:glycosyltransferase [bacterium]